VETSPLAPRVELLHSELQARGIRLRPHAWLSAEWFSPDGVPGIALPFFLAHPRLIRLEKRYMLEVEGGSENECMKLLRHETGHALCTAYRLHYRASWRRVFGSMTQPYPESYLPRAQSKDYVLHLDWWYAQAHPAEDFAETFAVWLKPNSRWRQRYRGWPALRKLEYVNELMQDIAEETPVIRSRRHVEPLRELKSTLREFYADKRERYGRNSPDIYDSDLLRLFSSDHRFATNVTAAEFLRRDRRRIREAVSRWTGEYQYTIDLVLRDMIERAKQLKLRLVHSERRTLYDATLMVAVRTMHYLHRVPHRIVL
jgi:hypothetical protein